MKLMVSPREARKAEREAHEYGSLLVARRKIAALNKLIALHQEYEQLLGNEINEIVALGYVHGWRSTRYEQGKQLRANIKALGGVVGTDQP